MVCVDNNGGAYSTACLRQGQHPYWEGGAPPSSKLIGWVSPGLGQVRRENVNCVRVENRVEVFLKCGISSGLVWNGLTDTFVFSRDRQTCCSL